METYILSESAYNALKDRVYTAEGRDAYLDSSLRCKWESDFYRIRFALKYELPTLEQMLAEEKGKEESNRGKLIFNSFRDLTPLEASNKLLWTSLAHFEYDAFCCSKWFKNVGPAADHKKFQDRILNRMFYRTGLNGVHRNSIARYYWGAKKTYDLWKSPDVGSVSYSFSDPYSITEYMMNDSQIWQDTMQRAIGASDYLRFTYLVSSIMIREYLLEKSGKNTISSEHYSKWLSKLFTCWINGSSYRSLSVDDAIQKFYNEALYLLPAEVGQDV